MIFDFEEVFWINLNIFLLILFKFDRMEGSTVMLDWFSNNLHKHLMDNSIVFSLDDFMDSRSSSMNGSIISTCFSSLRLNFDFFRREWNRFSENSAKICKLDLFTSFIRRFSSKSRGPASTLYVRSYLSLIVPSRAIFSWFFADFFSFNWLIFLPFHSTSLSFSKFCIFCEISV